MWGIGNGLGAPSMGSGPNGLCMWDRQAETPVCVECGQVVPSGIICPSCGSPIMGRTVYKTTPDVHSWEHDHHIFAGYM